MRKAAAVVASLIAAAAVATSASANKPGSTQCWTSASQVSLGQSYAIWASGLPSGGGELNLITQYPNGNTLTQRITSASDGAYAQAGSSFTATQAGTYTFMFVGKVNWPSGDWNKLYATCSMQAG
jgi:hypothetical protein